MKKKVLGLKSLIYGKFDTEATCAKKMGWPPQKLYRMVNGGYIPDLCEASEIACILGVDIERIADCFNDKH